MSTPRLLPPHPRNARPRLRFGGCRVPPAPVPARRRGAQGGRARGFRRSCGARAVTAVGPPAPTRPGLAAVTPAAPISGASSAVPLALDEGFPQVRAAPRSVPLARSPVTWHPGLRGAPLTRAFP